MNKSFILLLALCLVSVHAFVKRDADKPLDLETLQKDFQNKLSEFGKQLETTFDPEKIKKGLNDLIDGISKATKDGKAT
ncbi:uncharacterized protein LOC128672225 [Plodia interpunctella]|uniref:uncharacterized protein LOC128672225 n=1 Tax=Plodia interpunctella TaxID=58824 RepID=UPI002368AC56|nr:uncharacterized protein LOC128672225 [Plodia interpunctella]